MPSLKDLAIKITGIKKTEQITKAMNMVAAAKMRGAQDRMEQFRPYAEKFESVMGQLSGGANSNASPLMEVRDVKKVLLLVVTSDRGLCGAFNANIIKDSEKFLDNMKSEGRDACAACIGKKGFNYFKKTSFAVVHSAVDCMADIQMVDARKAGQEIIRLFVEGEIDEAHLVYGRFVNVAVQKPTFKKLLPISPEGLVADSSGEEESEEGPKATYIYEPAHEEILTQLLPIYVNVR
jgi:F-type H+-transporting ATPase subunit gamma